MDSFEFNKLAASLLIALLVGMTGTLIGDALIHPHIPEKNGYIIASTADDAASTASPTDEAPPLITPLLASANADNREKAFEKRCAQCHTAKKDAANKIGPNLWNVVLGPICHKSDYAYSTAMQNKKTEGGGTWDFEKLSLLIRQPSKYVKGTKMSFAGLKDDQERADIIAYLTKMNDNPPTLPTS